MITTLLTSWECLRIGVGIKVWLHMIIFNWIYTFFSFIRLEWLWLSLFFVWNICIFIFIIFDLLSKGFQRINHLFLILLMLLFKEFLTIINLSLISLSLWLFSMGSVSYNFFDCGGDCVSFSEARVRTLPACIIKIRALIFLCLNKM